MRVKIKTWEEMEKEFGLTKFQDIDCRRVFTKNMEKFMPEGRIIDISEHSCDDYFIWLVDGTTYDISEDMISKKFFDELPKKGSISEVEPSKDEEWSAKKFLDELPEEVIIPEDEPEKVDIFADDTFAINLNAINNIPQQNNHIHYLKWKITDNLSVRYFYSFDTKSEMIGKFGLKNHKHKQLTEISEETAKEMICSFCVEKFEEVIGYNVKGFGFKKYVKKFEENFVTLKNDKEIK